MFRQNGKESGRVILPVGVTGLQGDFSSVKHLPVEALKRHIYKKGKPPAETSSPLLCFHYSYHM